jgi:biotin carboxyl carrier protein
MDGYMGALELTVIALGALLLISFCFMGLTHALQWLAARSGGVAGVLGATHKRSAGLEVPAEPVIAAAPRTLGEDIITAPMHCRVWAVKVALGDEVKTGDVLVMLEEWEMLYEISAPVAGRVTEVFVVEGQYVKKGEHLIAIGG